MIDAIEVTTTVPSKEDAAAIAQSLVAEHLAACVQVLGPITSTYRWKGEIETAEEWQCRAKTARRLCDKIQAAIRRLHRYELPEILVTEVLAADDDYLAWLHAELDES